MGYCPVGVPMFWQSAYDWLFGLANSNFSSALFGAGFGAWAASWIALHSERHKRLREEISGCNTALGLAASIIETVLNLRSQLVLPMADSYRSRFQDFVAATQRRVPPGGLNLITFMADLRVVHFPTMPVPELRGLLQSSSSNSAAARALISSLAQSVESLHTMVQMRNEIGHKFRALQDEEKADLYFGLRAREGFIDDRYPDAMLGMVDNSEDVAYFSELLMEVLMKHGEALAKDYGRRPPKLIKVDLSEARAAGRLADRSRYPSFERQFRNPGGDLRTRHIR
jgi:hypothetical protein